jgi:hypothetical protein
MKSQEVIIYSVDTVGPHGKKLSYGEVIIDYIEERVLINTIAGDEIAVGKPRLVALKMAIEIAIECLDAK